MTIKWKKLGNVYCPALGFKYTHAMLPEVEVIDRNKGLIRIYYTHRDLNNYGFPTFLDAKIENNEFEIIYNHHEPIINKGDIGNFDDSGVNITSVLQVGEKRRFYYYGWNLGVTVPFRNAIGVAEADAKCDKMFLTRRYLGPILDRDRNHPGLCATPCVIKDKGLFRMYYTQGTPWIMKNGKANVACCIGYAESEDGLNWTRAEDLSVVNLPTDHVVTTPFVIVDNGKYIMWYSFRGEKYRIGYAESFDGKHFVRKDNEVGISVSAEGWDSEMVCYPKVFDLNLKRYMIYCGNSFGKTGFGLAVKSI